MVYAADGRAETVVDALDERVVGGTVDVRERHAALRRPDRGDLPVAQMGGEENAASAALAYQIDVLAPDKHIWSLLNPPQPGHAVPRAIQSAVHSDRFPTMSNAPQRETQPLREPAATVTLPTVLLTIGVVYTQMHYGVDVIAGLVITGLAVALTVALEKRTSPGAGRRGRLGTAP